MKLLNFSWNKNQTPRTSSKCIHSPHIACMPASVCGYHPDQLAFFVPNALKAVEAWKAIGYSEWITDVVTAQTFTPAGKESEFKVQLCFNYDIMPVEFELISVKEGSTVQIPNLRADPIIETGISHIGFHVEDIVKAVQDFADYGFKILSTIETKHHSGCNHKYRYVFLDTQALGFITKLIKRIK